MASFKKNGSGIIIVNTSLLRGFHRPKKDNSYNKKYESSGCFEIDEKASTSMTLIER